VVEHSPSPPRSSTPSHGWSWTPRGLLSLPKLPDLPSLPPLPPLPDLFDPLRWVFPSRTPIDPNTLTLFIDYPQTRVHLSHTIYIWVLVKDPYGRKVNDNCGTLFAHISQRTGKGKNRKQSLPTMIVAKKTDMNGLYMIAFSPLVVGTYISMVVFNGKHVQPKFTKLKVKKQRRKPLYKNTKHPPAQAPPQISPEIQQQLLEQELLQQQRALQDEQLAQMEKHYLEQDQILINDT